MLLTRPLATGLAVLLLGWIVAVPAGALTLSTDPLVLVPDAANLSANFGGVLTLVGVETGVPAGGSVLTGSVAGTDVTLVLEASLDAAAEEDAWFFFVFHPESLDAGYAGVRYTGAGTIPDGGADATSASLDGDFVNVVFDGRIAPGASTDRFFVSIPSLSDGTPFAAAIATIGSYGTATATLVPEPTTATLVALGLAIAGVRGRRGRLSPRH